MNTYITNIQTMSAPNKYAKWYIDIVSRGLQRANNKTRAKEILGYVEGHHVLPKFICDEIEKKDPNNIVFLSAKEHFICHWLLTKMVTGSAQGRAYNALNKFRQSNKYQTRILNGNEYEAIRRAAARWQANGGTNWQKSVKTIAYTIA